MSEHAIPLGGKPVDLVLLRAELADGGIPTEALLVYEDALTMLGADGEPIPPTPEALAVVDAHVAPPAVIDYVETRAVEAVTRTTDGAFRELWRLGTAPKRIYRAALEMRATDATDGTTKAQEARLVFKGLASTVVQVGATAVLWTAQEPAAAGWAIQAQVQGTDLVFGVRGAAGRTIDWSLSGAIVVFSPEGSQST